MMKYSISLIQLVFAMISGTVMAENGPQYDGRLEGMEVAEGVYTEYEIACETASDFDLCVCSQVEDLAETTKRMTDSNERFRSRENDNAYTKAFKKGVRDGMALVVDNHEKDCIDAVVCEDLGEYIAEMIAFNYCPGLKESLMPHSGEHPVACKDLSVIECKAHINDAFTDNGCDLRVSEVLEYQKKCLRQVLKKIRNRIETNRVKFSFGLGVVLTCCRVLRDLFDCIR